ncbi:DUF1330 domain-containing protein [Henriciella marina]|uniref:DUF1330 domain-containing protein n=1 Tax=Henriciella marina TaxID=453851 RepID=UPI00037E2C1D|nr:DUF1330 domain-containing protein [Henriciella marina]
MPALQPDTEQMTRFAKDEHDGPIVMINLLKFKDKAEYGPDDPEVSEGLTGEEAYNRYGEGLVALGNDPQIGLKQIYGGTGAGYLIGGGEEWDRVLVVHYPSRQHMLRMMRDPRYQKAHRHREAGLKYQELIETHPMG